MLTPRFVYSETHMTGLSDRTLAATLSAMVPSPFRILLIYHSLSLIGVSSAYRLPDTEYSPVLTADIQIALASFPHLVIRPLMMLHTREGLLKVVPTKERAA